MSIDQNLTEEQKKLKIQRLIGNLTRLAKNNPALRTALLGIKNPLTPWRRKTQSQTTKTKAVESLPTITPPPNQPPDPLKPTKEEHAALMNTASSSHHQPKTLEALATELLNNTPHHPRDLLELMDDAVSLGVKPNPSAEFLSSSSSSKEIKIEQSTSSRAKTSKTNKLGKFFQLIDALIDTPEGTEALKQLVKEFEVHRKEGTSPNEAISLTLQSQELTKPSTKKKHQP